MKYLLRGAALFVLLAAGPAWADNVFDCQDVGMSAPEPIGDQEGHALLTGLWRPQYVDLVARMRH